MKTIFTKHPRVLNMRGFWTYQSSEYASRSKDARVLNIPRILICLWFWICQGSEQTRVLNMLGLTGFWICLNMLDYVWLNMTGYVWICRYMREYAQICLNGFCFIFPYVIPCLLERVLTYFNVCTKLEVFVWRKMMLFSWRHKHWFFYSNCNFIWFLF